MRRSYWDYIFRYQFHPDQPSIGFGPGDDSYNQRPSQRGIAAHMGPAHNDRLVILNCFYNKPSKPTKGTFTLRQMPRRRTIISRCRIHLARAIQTLLFSHSKRYGRQFTVTVRLIDLFPLSGVAVGRSHHIITRIKLSTALGASYVLWVEGQMWRFRR